MCLCTSVHKMWMYHFHFWAIFVMFSCYCYVSSTKLMWKVFQFSLLAYCLHRALEWAVLQSHGSVPWQPLAWHLYEGEQNFPLTAFSILFVFSCSSGIYLGKFYFCGKWSTWSRFSIYFLFLAFFLPSFFFFFFSHPSVYGSSQARDGIWSAAATYATAAAAVAP